MFDGRKATRLFPEEGSGTKSVTLDHEGATSPRVVFGLPMKWWSEFVVTESMSDSELHVKEARYLQITTAASELSARLGSPMYARPSA